MTSNVVSNSATRDYAMLTNHTSETLAPSHILPDGRFVNLLPPTGQDRIRFFQRAIAQHGLLQQYTDRSNKEPGDEVEDEKKQKKKEEVKVHPLALASARLQADGISELNRAINLNTLVASGEYFGLTNVVDPSLEISATSAPSEQKSSEETTNKEGTASGKPESALEVEEEQRTKALFILKRKRLQFEKASETFRRHKRRLEAAIVTQSQPDKRLRQLRPQWRIIAPEHGTRALPHAARPTEVIACDVDVYCKDSTPLGRLARLVPRYATIELKQDYSVQADVENWRESHWTVFGQGRTTKMNQLQENWALDRKATNTLQNMDVGESGMISSYQISKVGRCTRAEPFAIADPALGKLDADFDPDNVAMLSLQFDIEKSSTGFCQSARLEPMSPMACSSDMNVPERVGQDESVVVALQHSLFCAKLFESIRREVAPDTEDIGQTLAMKTQQSVWLSGESEENFLPPPSMMMGDDQSGMSALCVVHCHEGEVKVQLDREYNLTVRLVEAGFNDQYMTENQSRDSGTQSPEQLLVLCRTLMLCAQEKYHRHSLGDEANQQAAQLGRESSVYKLKKIVREQSPCILQKTVSLGSKLLFEQRIRNRLMVVRKWLHTETGADNLQVEWLPLSIFDLSSYFTVCFRSWSVDVHLVRDQVTVTRLLDDSNYHKASFYSDAEFELFLMFSVRKELRSTENAM